MSVSLQLPLLHEFMANLRLLCVAAGVAALATAAPTAAQDYYTDIRPILVESCQGCHSAAGLAWSMEDAERTYERHERIARAVQARRMPPFLAEPGHQEYLGDRSLDPATIALVRRWAEGGFDKGEPRPDPAPPSHAAVAMAGHGGFAANLSLDILPAEGYLPRQDQSDDYRCFLVDWTADAGTFLTGFRAAPATATWPTT